MSEKFSQRLINRLRNAGDNDQLDFMVLLKPGLSAAQLDAVKQRLRALVDATIDHVPISGTMHFRGPVKAASEIETIDLVEQVDFESEAPIEELLDD